MFGYQITDADGDSSASSLSITIHGVTDGAPTIAANDGNGAEAGQATVYEAGLTSDGPGGQSKTSTGTLSVTAADGLKSVSIEGTSFTVAQLNGFSVGSPSASIDTGEGTIQITGFTGADLVGGVPTTGSLSYVYTLKARLGHTGATAAESTDVIALGVNDLASPTAGSGSANLTIRIVDDAPTANADANDVTEGTGTTTTTTSGNVFGATGKAATDVSDRLGADTTATPVSAVSFGATNGAVGTALAGAYGSLTLNADGTYTYALNNNLSVVNQLKAGQTLSEVFGYQITDADGDSSASSLSITIHGVTDGAPTIAANDGNGADAGQATVYEAGLTSDGPGGQSKTSTGTLSVTAADGLKSVSIEGTSFTVAQLNGFSVGSPSASIDTGEGTIQITGFTGADLVGGVPTTGSLSYVYTLKARLGHTGATAAESTDVIALGVNDLASPTAGSGSANLTIRIVDDAPTARNDVASISEDGAPNTVTGNLITAGAGADRVGADSPVPVSEISFGGSVRTLGGAFATSYGSLIVNADGSYSYTLDNGNPVVQHLTSGESLSETLSYTITDADGDSSTASLVITVHGTDDLPTLVIADGNGADAGQVTVGEPGLTSAADSSETRGGSFTLTALDGLNKVTVGGTDVSAAQLTVLGGTPLSISTPKGVITLTGFDASTGVVSYSYTLSAAQDHSGGAVSDDIVIVVTDRDGDTASATLKVHIVDDVPTARDDAAAITEDAKPDSVSGNVITTGPGADRVGADTPVTVKTVSIGALVQAAGTRLATTYGSIVINADGSYSYTLDNGKPEVQQLNADQTVTDTVTYTISDSDGNTSTAKLVITITGEDDPKPASGAVGEHQGGTEKSDVSGIDQAMAPEVHVQVSVQTASREFAEMAAQLVDGQGTTDGNEIKGQSLAILQGMGSSEHVSRNGVAFSVKLANDTSGRGRGMGNGLVTGANTLFNDFSNFEPFGVAPPVNGSPVAQAPTDAASERLADAREAGDANAPAGTEVHAEAEPGEEHAQVLAASRPALKPLPEQRGAAAFSTRLADVARQRSLIRAGLGQTASMEPIKVPRAPVRA